MSREKTKPDATDAAQATAQAEAPEEDGPDEDGPAVDGPETEGEGAATGDGAEAADGDAEDAAAEDAADAEDARDESGRLEAEIVALKDQVLRAMAETENVRRRAARDREDAGKYAITGFARDLLSGVDNLRRALDSLTDELRGDAGLTSLISGIEMTERELIAAFERHGIRRIDPLGEKFDHNFHQAMFEVADSDQPAGTVAAVMQAGYVIADRLLRPAMVGVAKGDKAAEDSDDEPVAHIDTKV